MKKIVSFIRHSHPEIYKALLLVMAIAIIVYIFPKQGKFKYEFENLKGKPWYYEDLIAPFDFAIKKTPEELANEKAEIIKNAKPYFRYNFNGVNERKSHLFKEFKEKWDDTKNKKAKDRTESFVKKIIDSIYSKGIIEQSDILENKPPDYTIYVLYNNVAEEHELKDFYTVNSAYEYLQEQTKRNENTVDMSFSLPLLENAIAHSLAYDKATTDKVLKQSLDDISPSRDFILKDQSIISKGDIVDASKYQLLQSLKYEYEEQAGGNANYFFIVTGQLLIIVLCMAVLVIFFAVFRNEIFVDNAKITFILLLLVLQVLMTRMAIDRQSFSIYILPFAVLPIIVRVFYDTRIALFVHIITILIISFMTPNRFEFAFIELLGGMIAVFSFVNLYSRSQIFISAGFIFITYSLAFIGINIIQEGGTDIFTWYDFVWFGISAFLTLFSYPLIFLFEKIFGFISDVSLLELSNTNSKLLRELASRAPGTFQHSLQVANLAEEGIREIGGNALLVRTGALYHDIGKMEMPMYFIENQANGVNPHEDMSYDESAAIIIGHVLKGVELAKRHGLPEQIIDFIRTHHGTTITMYFYRSFQKAFPDEHIDIEKFRYPGPIPFSKESAVLMMADSVEAASRSLKKYDAESVDGLVEGIINGQIEQDQFINADITFRDINKLKKIFKKKLMNIYHLRVEYPR